MIAAKSLIDEIKENSFFITIVVCEKLKNKLVTNALIAKCKKAKKFKLVKCLLIVAFKKAVSCKLHHAYI